MIGVYKPILEPLGLTHPQYLVMLVLWERGPVTVGDVATALHLESATVSPLVKRLESAGLVARSRTSDDERVVTITLTERGVGLRSAALDVPHQVVERLGLGLAELDALRAALTGFIVAASPAVVEQ